VVERASAYLAAFEKLDFSVVSYYEIVRGLLHAGAHRKLGDFNSLADISNLWTVDRDSAQHAAEICAELWARGEPIDDADLLIAGIARAHGMVVVTNNLDDFGRIEGLEVENWRE
jgi:tRNA(fMet)-specific endonuclease VapC